MVMTGWGSVESIVAAIREEARAESDRCEADSAATIARLQEEDRQRPVAIPDGEARLEAARRGAHERAAEENWADRQVALESRERWMARAVALGLERLRRADAPTRREDLLDLACEAAARVGGAQLRPGQGSGVEILVAADDLALADPDWCAQVAGTIDATVTVSADPAVTGGCIARSADGRLNYDNTFAARTRRFEGAWRSALSELLASV
jgi:vacuolar-type H+-ATPase subunit E/Vma4